MLYKETRCKIESDSDKKHTVKNVADIPSSAEVLVMIEKFETFAESEENVENEVFHATQTFKEFVSTEQRKSLKQSKITSFFKTVKNVKVLK